MITIQPLILPEVIPQAELQAWRDTIPKPALRGCPPEVREFIDALAAKLPDFMQVGRYRNVITGYELNLANMTVFHGKWIEPTGVYELPIPKMQAVDNRASMMRVYSRKGKQGLIDWVKARVKGGEQEKALNILNVHVFKQERPEFQKVMDEINRTKKMEMEIDV